MLDQLLEAAKRSKVKSLLLSGIPATQGVVSVFGQLESKRALVQKPSVSNWDTKPILQKKTFLKPRAFYFPQNEGSKSLDF